MAEPSIFRFLFRLSADARVLEQRKFLRRLVTGLANYYGASACRVYMKNGDRPVAAADDDLALERLDASEHADLADVDVRLVARAVATKEQASALDLPDGHELEERINEALGPTDIFAFPLLVGTKPQGAILLYLGENSSPIGEADIQALLAIGEILVVMQERAQA